MRRLVVTLASIVLAFTALGPTLAAAAADPLTVRTAAGLVRGSTDGDVTSWRGLPYAAPPVGALRWRPPQSPGGWPGVRPATEFAPPCAQPGPSGVDGSEDCLYLNVFAPDGTRSEARLPVLVHLHGGSNWFGLPYQDASALTGRGLMVVTVGYRLGVFGFAGHPALGAENGGSSGEYGVLDQIAALRWVQANIAAFGGDPGVVTLAGESAGSFDAVAIAASPLGRGLFARLAAQTESVFALRGAGRIADAEAIGSEVAATVGCAHAPDVAACLRAKPAEASVEAAGVGDVAPWTGGRVLPAPPQELLAAQSRSVPMLVGSNREEASFVFGQFVVDGLPYRTSDWVRDTKDVVGPQNASRARSLYAPSRYGSQLWSAVALFTDAIYTCPMRRVALTSRGPVYRYLYTHVYETDPVLASLRAGHFLDDPLLWHDGSLVGGYQFSPQEELLSARMAAYWSNFARTGNPNGPGLPTWPRFTAASERVVVLDEPGGEVRFHRAAECTFLDSLPMPFSHPRDFASGRGTPR
jgi:para-nitrobenzyl esterase